MGFLQGYTRQTVPPPVPHLVTHTSEEQPERPEGKGKGVQRGVHVALVQSNRPVGKRSGKANAGKKGTKAKGARKPTFSEIRTLAAETTVDVLHENRFPCAIFGGMACELYGNPRFPNDVDILVLPPDELASTTQEQIKDMLVEKRPDNFVIRAARDPEATYRVLFFRPTKDSRIARLTSSKVDILLPGVMHLPALAPAAIVMQSRMPVVPFAVLLLQKLQAWDGHRLAGEERYKKKAPVDANDLSWMLGSSGIGRILTDTRTHGLWSDRGLFSEEFEVISRGRVKAFCAAFPSWSDAWAKLGFEVSE
ncbi:hypothetical protein FPV67DRAFT_1423089 [Lyophyllum atratum]|nr:hypothetical protein FPV67DRAFT_1423089 [Lyophyllum atratum]